VPCASAVLVPLFNGLLHSSLLVVFADEGKFALPTAEHYNTMPRAMLNEHADAETAELALHVTGPDHCQDSHCTACHVTAREIPETENFCEEPEHGAYMSELPADEEEADLQTDGDIQALDRTADIYTDLPTMNYLLHDHMPPDADKRERDRILRRAKANQRGPDGRILHIM